MTLTQNTAHKYAYNQIVVIRDPNAEAAITTELRRNAVPLDSCQGLIFARVGSTFLNNGNQYAVHVMYQQGMSSNQVMPMSEDDLDQLGNDQADVQMACQEFAHKIRVNWLGADGKRKGYTG